MNINEISRQNILSGLGKSTKRGIKKCINCGWYNGTRSALCKNKQCGVVLKDSEEKSNVDLEAVKLFTGTSRQIYSVRVRDIGPDCRGFVQLPWSQSQEDTTTLLSDVALCFVESCQRSFDNSILKCHEENQSNRNQHCVHINAALKSQSVVATAINFNADLLKSLNLSEEFQQKLNALVHEKEAPLVQRVSKYVMAVKCQVTPNTPLGYLHFNFVRDKNGRKELFEKYCCNCTEFMMSGNRDLHNDNIRYKCVHYYACICALASDTKYSEEFAHFIDYELPSAHTKAKDLQLLVNSKVHKKRGFLRNKLMQKGVLTNDIVKSKVRDIKSGSKSYAIKLCTRKQRSVIKHCKRIMPKVFPIEIKVLNTVNYCNQTNDNVSIENLNHLSFPTWSFLDWLGFVTESINRTMVLDNCGIINTQIFYVPEVFFQCLKERIPNTCKALATETNLIYHIMNVLHLKELFDTPKIRLRISKKFVHDKNKGYVEFDDNSMEHQTNRKSCIFFLNVGESTVDESDNTNNPFVVEWMPNLFPITKIGQLKLLYKYGSKNIY